MNVLFEYDTVKRKPRIVSECLQLIREHFSIEDKNQQFIRRRLGRFIPVRKYAITQFGYFDFPFYENIVNYIKESLPNCEISYTKEFENLAQKQPLQSFTSNLKQTITPRDYQTLSAQSALDNNNGVIVLPTSAGKTLVIAIITNTILNKANKNVLILVPNLQLVHQTYKDFIEYGLNESEITIWTGNNSYNQNKIVIANYQILLSEKQNSKEILKNFEVCIVDECHKMASAEKITKLIKQTNFKTIYGFTGSLPDCQFSVWNINRVFGPIRYFKKSVELRNQKYISNVSVAQICLHYKDVPIFTKPGIDNPTAGYEEETNWLQTNSFRNNIIIQLCKKLETNTLILVDRIVHGEVLFECLTNNTDKKVYFVQGSVDIEEREQIRQLMESSNNIVCIAISKIFSTGISIKNLHNVIFAAIGKAKIKIIQSIGRSLRLHQSKESAIIFDIADISLTYGYKHAIEREKLYKDETIPLKQYNYVDK